MKKIRGAIIPMLTPIDERERPDPAQVSALAGYLCDGGVDALFVNGTSGEFARFTTDERFETLRAAVKAVGGRVPVLCGVSDCGTRLVIDNARRAGDCGADAVVTTLPYYFPTKSPAEQRAFIEAVLDASPLPVCLYNIPAVIGFSMDLDVLEALCGHGNLCGVKDTSGDPDYLRALNERLGDRISVYVGDERLLYEGLRMGAKGLVPSIGNPFPRLTHAIWDSACRQDWDSCRKYCGIVDRMNALNGFSDSWLSPNIWRKEALSQLGVCGAAFTSPHCDMDMPTKQTVGRFISEYRGMFG